MKRLLSILLLLTVLLCGCKISTDRNPYSDTPLPTETVEDSEDAHSPEDLVSPEVQYIRDYQTTPLMNGRYVTDIFAAEDGFWVLSEEWQDSRVIARLERYTNAGEHVETVHPPMPSDVFRDGWCAVSINAVCSLRDGQWFLLCRVDDGTKSFFKAYILSAAGETLYERELKENMTADTYLARSDGSGGLHFLVHDRKTIRYYDETLTERAVLQVPDEGECHWIYHVSDDVYILNRLLFGGMYMVDLSAESIRVTNPMLPDGYEFAKFNYGLNGETYVIEHEGISRYDNGTLIPILNWAECGLQNDVISDTYWILDDRNILRASSRTMGGVYSRELSHIAVSEREASTDYREIRIKADISNEPNRKWLTAAISAFNRRNDDYRVLLDMITTAGINDVLLFDEETDLLFTDTPSHFFVHYDKNAFLDIGYAVEDILLGGVYDSYVTEDGALYAFPLSMALTALAANADIAEGSTLTWEDLYAYRDTLPDGAYLIAPGYRGGAGTVTVVNGQRLPTGYQMTDMIQNMYRYALTDYVDFKKMTSSFDSAKFREMILFLDWLSSHVDANIGGTQFSTIQNKISNGTLVNRVRGGGVTFMETNIHEVLHFSLLQRMYGENTYTLCGFPSADGGYVLQQNSAIFPAILADTDVGEGCIAFVQFLLSDEMQSHERFDYLPVTVSAMAAQLDANRYQYYHTEDIELLESGSPSELELMDISSSHEEIEDYGGNGFYTYETYEFTDDDCARILDFFSGIRLRSAVDHKILEIVNEELSYWANDARTLEETTKIIDSRVWIYLNE